MESSENYWQITISKVKMSAWTSKNEFRLLVIIFLKQKRSIAISHFLHEMIYSF